MLRFRHNQTTAYWNSKYVCQINLAFQFHMLFLRQDRRHIPLPIHTNQLNAYYLIPLYQYGGVVSNCSPWHQVPHPQICMYFSVHFSSFQYCCCGRTNIESSFIHAFSICIAFLEKVQFNSAALLKKAHPILMRFVLLSWCFFISQLQQALV